MTENQQPNYGSSVSYANQANEGKALASIASLLRETVQLLPILRQEFRGEATVQFEDGAVEKVQVCKPLFVRMDMIKNEPIKILKKYPQYGEKEIYLPNDEAIEEILSMLKFMGLNNITSITNISEGTVLDDLLEFESKLAGILALKQKQWGLDKELLPMTMMKIKTIVQDARYMAVNGSTIKAIQKTVQRIESSVEGEKKGRGGGPYA